MRIVALLTTRYVLLLLCCSVVVAQAQTRRQINADDITTALGYAPASTAQVTNDVLTALGTGTVVPPSNGFYTDQGGRIVRFGDRLFVGGGTNNQGLSNRDALPRDWLSAIMAPTSVGAWPVYGSQVVVLSRYGNIGILGASHTLDAVTGAAKLGYIPASIGVMGVGISDATDNPTTTTAWGLYAEGWRMSGVNYQPTFAAELEAINRGGITVGQSNPYHVNNGGGVYGLQVGCGGGHQTGAYPCDAAITVVQNPQVFQRGIVFASNSIQGTTGDTTDYGFASALEFGANQGIQWRTPETRSGQKGSVYGLMIRSTVKNNLNATRWEGTDTGFTIGNTNGQPLFAVYTYTNAVSGLHIEPGISNSDGSATVPGALVVDANAGSPNLGLFPAVSRGGVIATKGTPVWVNNGSPTAVGGGYLKILVNNTAYYLPLYLGNQVGQ